MATRSIPTPASRRKVRRSARRPSCSPRSLASRWSSLSPDARATGRREVSQLGDLPLAARFPRSLDWQWEEKVIPYWTEAHKICRRSRHQDRHRMHPGFVAYNPESMLKLRSIAVPPLDVTTIPATCSGKASIPLPPFGFWATASSTFTPRTLKFTTAPPITGVLDTKKYTDERNRGWIFRTCGYGHGAEWWSEFISTLRMFGYDYVLSVEHEDSLMSPEEGLTKAVRSSMALSSKNRQLRHGGSNYNRTFLTSSSSDVGRGGLAGRGRGR